jgi:hypothetical protein
MLVMSSLRSTFKQLTTLFFSIRKFLSGSNNCDARRIFFRLSEVLPPDRTLSVPLLRLMMSVNDVRHIQKLLLPLIDRTEEGNEFERIALNGEILHLQRLLCGHLYEAGTAFRAIDVTNPELANAVVRGEPEYESALQTLREIYASDPPGAFHRTFLKEIRDQFGFHYQDGPIRAQLENFIRQANVEGTAIVAEHGGLSRYSIGDHISIGLIQDLLNAEIHTLHAGFSEATQKTLKLAKALSTIVDLMLLPLLERPEAIIRIEESTLPVPVGLVE